MQLCGNDSYSQTKLNFRAVLSQYDLSLMVASFSQNDVSRMIAAVEIVV